MPGHVGPIETLTDGNRSFRTVPEGTRQNLTDASKRRLRLCTRNAPRRHVDRLVEAMKAVAHKERAERAFLGSTGKHSK